MIDGKDDKTGGGGNSRVSGSIIFTIWFGSVRLNLVSSIYIIFRRWQILRIHQNPYGEFDITDKLEHGY